jgi:hypothetical protein
MPTQIAAAAYPLGGQVIFGWIHHPSTHSTVCRRETAMYPAQLWESHSLTAGAPPVRDLPEQWTIVGLAGGGVAGLGVWLGVWLGLVLGAGLGVASRADGADRVVADVDSIAVEGVGGLGAGDAQAARRRTAASHDARVRVVNSTGLLALRATARRAPWCQPAAGAGALPFGQ